VRECDLARPGAARESDPPRANAVLLGLLLCAACVVLRLLLRSYAVRLELEREPARFLRVAAALQRVRVGTGKLQLRRQLTTHGARTFECDSFALACLRAQIADQCHLVRDEHVRIIGVRAQLARHRLRALHLHARLEALCTDIAGSELGDHRELLLGHGLARRLTDRFTRHLRVDHRRPVGASRLAARLDIWRDRTDHGAPVTVAAARRSRSFC
jgi:hypothetical protein